MEKVTAEWLYKAYKNEQLGPCEPETDKFIKQFFDIDQASQKAFGVLADIINRREQELRAKVKRLEEENLKMKNWMLAAGVYTKHMLTPLLRAEEGKEK